MGSKLQTEVGEAAARTMTEKLIFAQTIEGFVRALGPSMSGRLRTCGIDVESKEDQARPPLHGGSEGRRGQRDQPR